MNCSRNQTHYWCPRPVCFLACAVYSWYETAWGPGPLVAPAFNVSPGDMNMPAVWAMLCRCTFQCYPEQAALLCMCSFNCTWPKWAESVCVWLVVLYIVLWTGFPCLGYFVASLLDACLHNLHCCCLHLHLQISTVASLKVLSGSSVAMAADTKFT